MLSNKNNKEKKTNKCKIVYRLEEEKLEHSPSLQMNEGGTRFTLAAWA